MKKINKNRISISIDKQLDDVLNEEFNNKSKYIEWLIYKDFKKNNVEGINKIII